MNFGANQKSRSIPIFSVHFLCLMMGVILVACTPKSDDDDSASTPTAAVSPTPCSHWALVTDIDETLTTSDNEFATQLLNPSHDPAMRPEAELLMQDYAALGFEVVYVTARGENITLLDGRSARQATNDWLVNHGFPAGPLYLAQGLGAFGQAAIDYKTEVITTLQAEGTQFEWAYGNAESDIAAFQNSNIPDDHIFLVGALAGTLGVQPVPDEEAFVAHRATHLQMVTDRTCD